MKKKILSVFLGMLVFAGCNFFGKSVDVDYTKKITLITQGVTPSVAEIKKDLPIGAKIDLKDSAWFVKAGDRYSFAGIFITDTGTRRIDDNFVFTLDAKEDTIYARWASKYVKVKFVTQNVTPSVADIEKELLIGAKIDLKDSTWFVKSREGFDFLGIFNVATNGTRIDENLTFTFEASMTTLYARWMPKPKEGYVNVTVNAPEEFIAGGQTIAQLPIKEGVNLKEFLTNVPFDKAGFTFEGVFTTATGGTRIDENLVITVTANTTALYLRWKAAAPNATIKVKFVTQGVTPAVADIEKSWIVGTKIDLKDSVWFVKTREGYEFLGIFTTETDGERIDENLAFTLAANMTTLYIRWTQFQSDGKVHIKFNVNGGSGTAPATMELTPPVLIILPAQEQMTAPEGKVFVGWTFSLNAQNPTIFAPGSNYLFEDAGHFEFFAVWETLLYPLDKDITAAFTDANFRAEVYVVIGKTAPAPILYGDVRKVTDLGLSFIRSITSLAGIEYFTELTYLNCSYNQLTSLNVSGLTNLTYLLCSDNQLTSLNVSGLTNLQELDCYNNQLTSLDVSGLTNLTYLLCYSNQLTSLNVSGLTNLNYLNCSHNDQLTSLNVTGLTNLKVLYCYDNPLTSLDVSGLTNLQELYCYRNQLTSLNVSGLTNLQALNCSNNQLTSLNVSGLTNLQRLDCYNNQLTSLNVSGLTNLQELNCINNQLTSLDVSGLTNLQALYCSDNQLTSLDVSGLTNLQRLDCNENQLTSLDVSGLTSLRTLNVKNNKFANKAAIVGLDESITTNFDFDPQNP